MKNPRTEVECISRLVSIIVNNQADMVCFDCTVVKACDVTEAVILDNAAVEGDSSYYRNDLA